MTTETTNVWNVFFEDKRYNNLLNELNSFINETRNLIKQGYKLNVIDEKQNSKIGELQMKFKELGQTMLDERESKMNEIENDLTSKDVADPQQELIKRQDLEARLSLIDANEVIDRISNLKAENTSVYEISAYQNVLEGNKLSEAQKNQVAIHFSDVKQKVLYPFNYNNEYQKLSEEYNTIVSSSMASTGVPVTTDDYGIVYKSVADRYSDVFKEQAK